MMKTSTSKYFCKIFHLVLFIYLCDVVTSLDGNLGNENGLLNADEDKTRSNLFPFLVSPTLIPACFGEDEGPKFLNDTCEDNADCYGGGVSMWCKNQRCICKEGHISQEIYLSGNVKENICFQAPSLFQPCSSVCQKPLTCQNNSVITPDFKTPPFPSITGKSCQCVPPFKFQDGICYLECEEDKYFIEDRCVKKCKPNEVRLQDYRCAKVAPLGSPCESSYQCSSTFSECQNGTCKCLPGFKSDNSSCVAESVRCPIGQALTDGSTIVQCKTNRLFSLLPLKAENRKVDKETAEELQQTTDNSFQKFPFKDSCPDTHFCLASHVDYGAEGSGHCCTKPNVSCPVGSQHSNAVCMFDPEGLSPYCPQDTHYCHSIVIGAYNEQVCCARACADGFVQVEGFCYPTVSFGDQCKVDEQCRNHNGICKSGNCTCSKNMKPIGSQFYQFCQMDCAINEVLYENQCHPRFKIADSCNATSAFRCPLNSACKKNKCTCLCTMYPINERLCGPLPVCPNSADGQQHVRQGFSSIQSASKEISPKEVLANATFCKVGQKKAPVEKVMESCTDGQYCSNYVTSLGLCCNKPEPICPNGQKPESIQFCDNASPFSCGSNKFCHRYIHPADINSQDGFICCTLESPQIFLPVELPPPQIQIP